MHTASAINSTPDAYAADESLRILFVLPSFVYWSARFFTWMRNDFFFAAIGQFI